MFERIKKWFKPTLYNETWYNYVSYITFKDGESCSFHTNKYTYLNEEKFIELILTRNKALQIDKIFCNVDFIKSISCEVVDEITLHHYDELDTIYILGNLATKEQLEEYNKKVLK